VARILDLLRSPFSFLFAKSQKEELVAAHIVREHHRGRSLTDILEDPYVTNRMNTEQVRRVLDRPEVVRAIGDDTVAAQRSEL
jgi:hypothetical protein